MDKFIPKDLSEESWQPLTPNVDYAILCGKDNHVHLRFGPVHGLFVGLAPSSTGRLVNSVDPQNGTMALLGKLSADGKTVFGRTSDCTINLKHAIVSRRHLEATLRGNILVVRDLGSTNGTFVFKDIPHFDIAQYLKSHPLDKSEESTLDSIHEAFGPTLDDFLKNYSQSKGSN